jgi:hypothetical protein
LSIASGNQAGSLLLAGIERLQRTSDRDPVDQIGSLSSVDDDRDAGAKLSFS